MIIFYYYFQFDKYNSQEEIIELKDSEIQELRKHCKQCYDAELNLFQKSNIIYKIYSMFHFK